jgi:hypothetical protein
MFTPIFTYNARKNQPQEASMEFLGKILVGMLLLGAVGTIFLHEQNDWAFVFCPAVWLVGYLIAWYEQRGGADDRC